MTENEKNEFENFKKEYNENISFVANTVKLLDRSNRKYWIERIFKLKNLNSKIEMCQQVRDYFNLKDEPVEEISKDVPAV